MTPPRLVACHFVGEDRSPQWARLATVLAYSARRYCPGWEIAVTPIAPAPLTSALGIRSHVHNTQKMDCWAEAVAAAPDGTRLLLIDADMMILRPLEDIWQHAFDYAYTIKASRFPFNSGVVFLRVSAQTRAFVRAWQAENRRMLTDGAHHATWRKKYGGINQAALGYALESNLTAGLTLGRLPCREWNCEDSSWATFSPATTRIVHCKSALRKAIFGLRPIPTRLVPLVRIWERLEAAATAAGAETGARPASEAARTTHPTEAA